MRWHGFLTTMLFCAETVRASCAWHTTDRITITGDIEQGGLHGTFQRVIAPGSGRFTESIDLGILKTGSGFNGRLGWSRDPSGASHYLNSAFARSLATSEAWLTAHLSCPAPSGRLGAIPLGSDKSTRTNGWRLTPPDGAPVELWYDERSGRLDHAVLQYSENRIVHHYSNWREVVPGRLIPFVQRDEDPEDESEQTYTARKIEHKGLQASFEPPAAPKDAAIAGLQSTVVPFEDDQRHRVFVPVYLNGKGPFTFELDSGGHFILTEATASALGLKPQGSFTSTGAGTEVHQSGYVPIEELRVGEAVVTHQTAKVLPLSHNDRPGSAPRAGLLGLEFFERFIVSIDHRTKKVTLHLISSRDVAHRGRPLRIAFDEDAPLTEGAYDGIPGTVMLDIGNASPTIVEHSWAAKRGLVPELARGTPRGSAKLSKGRVRIGPFDMSGESVVYFGPAERGSEHTQSVALMVGEPLLSRFNAIYDYGRDTVWLEPLPQMAPVSFDTH